MIYNSKALAKESGATYRQIHYWTENGALVPMRVEGESSDGSGHRRLYDDTELAVARGLVLMSRSVLDLAPDVRRAVTHGKSVIAHGFSLTRGVQ